MAHPRDISLRQLRYFRAAAEMGQFSLAAASEHISQSAITAAVAQLEQALNVSLFERLPYGVRLTLEGHRFLERTRSILNAVQDAVSEPLSTGASISGTVRIGASYTVLGYYLPTVLMRFRRSYPEVEFDLQDMDRVSIENAVSSGALDLGLIIVSNSDPDLALNKAVLMQSKRQVWLPVDHPLMQAEKISLKDLEPLPYLMFTVDEGEASTNRYWQQCGVSPRVAFRTSSMEALRGLVANGFGVTVLSKMVFRHWSLEGRRLETRPLSDPVPDMELGLIWNEQSLVTPEARAVQQFLLHSA
ncbi:LysR family transcriptional regulator [Pseudomonas syringae]|nr:LysR family transcriptional regulator [Pseudomonas syringae]MBD8576095.1 LysR family transcriptional regulator [Pseudomonas syringae]MBD8792387.1 LysR family transcriptional regulator [Pseudomonas syringae]MBD8802143.1 LysR family transcriptional regulator [Pseudomonas syringae]MBD8813912.1 LysR family transcriptional regulator [Pseudomonas syringae]